LPASLPRLAAPGTAGFAPPYNQLSYYSDN